MAIAAGRLAGWCGSSLPRISPRTWRTCTPSARACCSSAWRALRPYADDHPLARRLQLPLTGPRPADAELAAAGDACLEAQLRPGDVLFFPARWAHHTEATAPEGERAGARGAAAGADQDEAREDEASWSLGFRTDGQFLM